MKKLFLIILILNIILITELNSSETNENTPLLGYSNNQKREIVDPRRELKLTELPLPIQLDLLEYLAADDQEGPKTIKALTQTNKHFNSLCGNLDSLPYKRGQALEKLLAQHLKITPKNAKKIFEVAQKNNDQKAIQKVYKAINYKSDWRDNCQDCCVCTLPWFQSPWEKEWDEACQKNYQKRIQEKYGIASYNALNHVNYKEYKESSRDFLGVGACMLMYSMRAFFQLALCPFCMLSCVVGYSCNKNYQDRKDFAEGKTVCGWIHWPCFSFFCIPGGPLDVVGM